MAPIATFLSCVQHTVKSARLQAQEIARREKLLCANKGTFLAMRDPRLYSRKLQILQRSGVGRRLEGTKSEGEAHFVRNYALLANYLHRSH